MWPVMGKHVAQAKKVYFPFNLSSSLRAGSPLSHTREWRREKRSSGKESGEEIPRK